MPINKQLGGFKSASVRGTAKQNYNGLVFNDEKGMEHLSIHSEHNLSLNSEKNKMVHAGSNKGERVGIANILTVGKIIPVTGGSGGGNFEGGNTIDTPPPSGIMGMNSVVTYGDEFQLVSGVSHQITIGQNLQMCISLGALFAETLDFFGGPSGLAPVSAQVLGGHGRHAVYRWINAQFTLGQTFEISVGPPKIEIHKAHCKKFDLTRGLCILMGALAELFSIVYDHLKGAKDKDNSTSGMAAMPDEEEGDVERAKWILGFQALTDIGLVGIMLAEYYANLADWIAADSAREAYVSAHPLGLWKATPKKIPGWIPFVGGTSLNPSWSGGEQLALGLAGVAIMVLAELTDLPVIGDHADEQ